MVILNFELNGEKRPLYMDNELDNQIDKRVIPAVQKKDFDYFLTIDGQEGSGKSVFAMQLAKRLDPNFSVDQIAFTPQEFIKCVVNAKKFQCILFDEAFTGLSSRSSLSEINQLLVALMMECRQRNLFVIICMPSVFMLDKYVVLHRTKGLFHVYMSNGRRGFWRFYNRKRLKPMYIKGKKYYEYGGAKAVLFGRFRDQYTIDETEYRARKKKALVKKQRTTKAQQYKAQRDVLFYILHKDMKQSYRNTEKLCKNYGYSVGRSTISDIITSKSKEILQEDQLSG